MELREYLKDYRQNRLAEKIGMDKATFSRKLNGRQKWTPVEAARIEKETDRQVPREAVLKDFDWSVFQR
jgi:DNA-binding transcriptional regulator YdaS (Cro superfamily)